MLDILYFDSSLAVCVKPAGVLSEGESEGCMPYLLSCALKEKGIDAAPLVVHRLDKETMGIMVFALDSRGQGANEPVDEYHYKDMATDVFEFIKAKGLEKPAVFGFSDGGNIALQLEVMYPGTLGAIATGGANIFVHGSLVPDFESWFLTQENPSPLTRMMLEEPTMTPEDMQTISCPALIMSGEHDLIRQDHTQMIGENIPNGQARIIPGEDHGSYICNSPKITGILLDFFEQIGY